MSAWIHAEDCPASVGGRTCRCRPSDDDEHQADANTTSGWSAECTDCPYTIDPMYGARCFPRTESGDRDDVADWVRRHVERFPGHRPLIAQFTRWTVHVSQVNPTVLATLFGPDGGRPDPVAELLDTVQRVKNIVWQNFGIEPGIPTRALPAGRSIPRVDERGWHYLIRFPDGHVAQCAGDWDVAHKHLRLIRAEPCFAGGPVPTLIGAYPPDSIGGPDGRGGVYSFGYSPDVIGSIDVPRPEWRTAR